MGVANTDVGKPGAQEVMRDGGCWSRNMQKAFPSGFRSEFWGMMSLLPSLVIATMCQWYVQPVATMFAGHLGKIELDAVGLSCSLINILGYSLAFGMTAACDSSFAQTYGGNNKKMMGIYLQKCLFIITLAAFPCYAIHLNIEGVLLLVGQDPEVARLCGRYLLVHTPGTFALFVYLTLQKFFQCQSVVVPDIWMGVVTHAIHAIMQYVFLYQLNLGIDGSAIAQATFYVVAVLLRVIYFNFSKKFQITWAGWSLQCFGSWGALAKLAVYGAILMCAEWWAYEACTILAGLLGTAELAAQTITFNFILIATAIPTGITLASIVRMGHHLGGGNPEGAKTAARVGTVIEFVIAVLWCAVLLIFYADIGKLFSTDEDVLVILRGIIPILAFIIFVDCFTILARNIFRGVAKQKEAAIIVFFSYYVVALPLGYSLMFLTPLSLQGMWIGFLVSTLILAIIMTIRYLWWFNWEDISHEAQIRACVKVENDTHVPHSDRTRLISEREGKEHYGTISASQEKPSLDTSFFSATASIRVDTNFNMAEEQISSSDVIKKILIIFVFVGMIVIGLIVRLATQDIIAQYRTQNLIGISTQGPLWNITNFSQISMQNTSFPSTFSLAN